MSKPIVILVIAIFVLITISSSFYTVRETEQVAVDRFGAIVTTVEKPGINFKIPFVDSIVRLEKRWLEWDGEANKVTTRDKRFIFIDVFARWRISDPLLFIKSLGRGEVAQAAAQTRLDAFLDGATRNVIAKHNLIEAVRSSNREFVIDEQAENFQEVASSDADNNEKAASPSAEGAVATDDTPDAKPKARAVETRHQGADSRSDYYRITMGREKLTRLILETASEKTRELGIELKDVQIKRINYTDEVRVKVFERMISERKRVAEGFRSKGRGLSANIKGQMEKELKKIESGAYRKAEEIRGASDAEAASVYAKAYEVDPEFYAFVKTLESYEQTIDSNSWLLLSTDAEYVKLLSTMKAK